VAFCIPYPCFLLYPPLLSTQLQTKRESWLVGFFFLHFCYFHVCPTLPASSCYLIFISHIPQPHLNHTHLLSSQLSIPNRLIGLWQKMQDDLLDSTGSSGACLTYLHLLRKTFNPLSSLSSVFFSTQHMLTKYQRHILSFNILHLCITSSEHISTV